MAGIVVYRTRHCGYCVRVHALLQARGLSFQEIDVTDDPAKRSWLIDVTKRRTVPQVFIDGAPVGGFDELARLNRTGELDRLVGDADRRQADSV